MLTTGMDESSDKYMTWTKRRSVTMTACTGGAPTRLFIQDPIDPFQDRVRNTVGLTLGGEASERKMPAPKKNDCHCTIWYYASDRSKPGWFVGYQHPDVREVSDEETEQGTNGKVSAGSNSGSSFLQLGEGREGESAHEHEQQHQPQQSTASANQQGMKKGSTPSAADSKNLFSGKRAPFYKRVSGNAQKLSMDGWKSLDERYGSDGPFLVKWDKVDAGLENFLEPCAKQCNGGGKDCDSFCGVGGSCCKKGDRSKGCGGLVGGLKQHVCVPKVRADQILRDYYVSKSNTCDMLSVKTIMGTAQVKEATILCPAFERNGEWKGKVDIRVPLDSADKLKKILRPTAGFEKAGLGVCKNANHWFAGPDRMWQIPSSEANPRPWKMVHLPAFRDPKKYANAVKKLNEDFANGLVSAEMKKKLLDSWQDRPRGYGFDNKVPRVLCQQICDAMKDCLMYAHNPDEMKCIPYRDKRRAWYDLVATSKVEKPDAAELCPDSRSTRSSRNIDGAKWELYKKSEFSLPAVAAAAPVQGVSGGVNAGMKVTGSRCKQMRRQFTCSKKGAAPGGGNATAANVPTVSLQLENIGHCGKSLKILTTECKTLATALVNAVKNAGARDAAVKGVSKSASSLLQAAGKSSYLQFSGEVSQARAEIEGEWEKRALEAAKSVSSFAETGWGGGEGDGSDDDGNGSNTYNTNVDLELTPLDIDSSWKPKYDPLEGSMLEQEVKATFDVTMSLVPSSNKKSELSLPIGEKAKAKIMEEIEKELDGQAEAIKQESKVGIIWDGDGDGVGRASGSD